MEIHMTDEKVREFSLRISQATRTGLVVITDEIIISYIDSAQKALEGAHIEDFRFQIGKAKQFLDGLSSALDMRFEISHELLRLYAYVRKCLIMSEIRESEKELLQCRRVMESLKQAFEKVAESDQSGLVMEGSQKVYAGLTYGPGSTLNETVF